MIIGNVSKTITTQYIDAGILYVYNNIGNSTSSVGVGFNIKNWYGVSVYVGSNLGVGSSVQVTPYVTFGTEISVLGGVSFSVGTISGNITNETTVNIGWGTLAFAYAACGVAASTPVPGARVAAGAAACIVFLIDIFI